MTNETLNEVTTAVPGLKNAQPETVPPQSKPPMVWHYTTAPSFAAIRKDGLIRPSTMYLTPGERPIVWFSSDPLWEHTVVKGVRAFDGSVIQLGMSGLLARGVGLIRIGVDPDTAPMTWPELKRHSRMPAKIARGLVRVANGWGASASKWRGTFDAVPTEKWQAIEHFENRRWTALEPIA